MNQLLKLSMAVLLLTSACRPTQPPFQSVPLKPVTIGCGAETLGGLVFLADAQGHFRQAGLPATVRSFPSGKLALEALLRGEVAVAACASTPVAFAAMSVPDLRVLAVVGSSDSEMKIVARRDRDILRPVDLRGRKIATQKASSLHVFLHLFLLKEGLTESDVQLDFRAPDELANDLIAGKSDAAALREPQLSQVKAALGSNAVVFAERGLYVKYYLLVTRAAFLEQEPATVAAILRAVLAAEKAARANPAAAQTALAGKLQVTTAIAALLWPDMDLRVSLPQALVLCLEDEARWAARSGFVTNRPPPNFLTMMHVATLEQLVPDEVTIIR